ncbi:hypothetical protein F2Q69_00030854 [Brassica cretica]|uniref:Uncharacterized protein n=1 Tax=Brassica cretica TaxID=69181 RepID=A0A8S9RUW5_BRACR|nr:hypothetical protein F2Q69_00030854 [Brassica cretica]
MRADQSSHILRAESKPRSCHKPSPTGPLTSQDMIRDLKNMSHHRYLIRSRNFAKLLNVSERPRSLEVEEPGHGDPERAHGLIHLSVRDSGTFITDTGYRFRSVLRDLDGDPKLSDPSFDRRNQRFGMGTPNHKTRHLGDLGRKREILVL